MGEIGPHHMYSFSACNGAVKDSLKRTSDLGPPISLSGHQGRPQFHRR